MTILEKLHTIEQAKCIYNIHYCKAGVGFCFYEEDFKKDWRDNLRTDRYYPSFAEAVEAEFARLPNSSAIKMM